MIVTIDKNMIINNEITRINMNKTLTVSKNDELFAGAHSTLKAPLNVCYEAMTFFLSSFFFVVACLCVLLCFLFFVFIVLSIT